MGKRKKIYHTKEKDAGLETACKGVERRTTLTLAQLFKHLNVEVLLKNLHVNPDDGPIVVKFLDTRNSVGADYGTVTPLVPDNIVIVINQYQLT